MEAEVDSLKLVNPAVPALGHPSHLGLVHLGENGNDDCAAGREGGREDDRLRWVSPGKERTTSSHAQDGHGGFWPRYSGFVLFAFLYSKVS